MKNSTTKKGNPKQVWKQMVVMFLAIVVVSAVSIWAYDNYVGDGAYVFDAYNHRDTHYYEQYYSYPTYEEYEEIGSNTYSTPPPATTRAI